RVLYGAFAQPDPPCRIMTGQPVCGRIGDGMALVCQLELPGEVSITVLDSGGHMYGRAACNRFDWLAKDPTPGRMQRWAAVGELLNGLAAVQPATKALGQATAFDAILRDYAASWKDLQAAYAKEQADAAKAKTCSQIGLVS